MPIETGKPFEFKSESEGVCVCGAAISMGYANGHPTVLHPLPMCETFNRFESPTDYVRYLNQVQGGN